MSRFPYFACLCLAGAALCQTVAFAQPPAPVPAKITTVDGVKLNATFYGSAKKNSPVVIMVHPIGEGKNSKPPEWKALAEYLQKQDLAVITFDLRGHGDSTTVDADVFWGKKGVVPDLAQQFNRKNVKQSPKDPEIVEVKDFIKSPMYLPALCNDIAAVRAYLDRQNDTGECNTANILVIGAENGATLAALWMNAEWSRFKYIAPNMMAKGIVDKRAEGADIIGAVFLSIQPSLHPTSTSKTLKVTGLLRNACKDNGTAATFFVGKEDQKSRDFAKTLESNLKISKSKKHEFIGAVELATNLSGIKLLQEGLMTEKTIAKYLSAVVDERGTDWATRDFMNTHYIWRIGNNPLAPLLLSHNLKGTKNLNFDDYNKFITP